MFFCFIDEDLAIAEPHDPLAVQAQYAKVNDCFCVCSIKDRCIYDAQRRPIALHGKPVMLRVTCDYLDEAISILSEGGAELLETAENISAIENWESLNVAKRVFYAISLDDLRQGSFSIEVKRFLKSVERVFLKTRKKGISINVSSVRILDLDPTFLQIITNASTSAQNEFLLTEALHIKKDALGTKESRHFVFNKEIRNSSRYIHTATEVVPVSLITAAQAVVDQLSGISSFPANYVLDMALFEKNGERFADIVEINPISNAMCYSGNTIFTSEDNQTIQRRRGLLLGPEFEYDKKMHPLEYGSQKAIDRATVYRKDDSLYLD